MKNERLLKLMGEIDERYIAEAAPAAKKPAKPRRIKWAAAAACLCLVGFGIFAAVRGGSPSGGIELLSPPASAGAYRFVLINEPLGDERWDPAHVRLITAEQGVCLPGWPEAHNGAGSQEVAVYVAPREEPGTAPGEMTLEEAEEYAYLDPDSASEEMREKILAARKVIIFHSRWVADGYSGSIQDAKTGENIETLPTFSELFPGWALPVYDTAAEQVTEDGLGADCLYGLEATVLRINAAELICSSREPMNRFGADQPITVFPPEDGLPELKAGDTIFISYYGRDCSVKDGVIRADGITHASPFDPEP